MLKHAVFILANSTFIMAFLTCQIFAKNYFVYMQDNINGHVQNLIFYKCLGAVSLTRMFNYSLASNGRPMWPLLKV